MYQQCGATEIAELSNFGFSLNLLYADILGVIGWVRIWS